MARRNLGSALRHGARMALVSSVIGALAVVLPEPSGADEEVLGLVIVGHGAPMPSWNAPVLALEDEVTDLYSERGGNPFRVIRVALMEFAEPSINTVIEELEAEGVDQVFVLPLFVAPSRHSLLDVPAILGLYHDSDTVSELTSEGTAICDTEMRITVGPTMHLGELLKESMLDRVRELSVDPSGESVVLLAHGDETTNPLWESICADVGSYICAETGIARFEYALVEIGQSFPTEGLDAVAKAAEDSERTLVIGMYLSMGVDMMARNASVSTGLMEFGIDDVIGDKDVRFAERGILPDPRVVEWIVDRADEWLKDRPRTELRAPGGGGVSEILREKEQAHGE